jgi:4-guanidinobutyraldehyde dehydrogenase/NAD-dependent aldehyde dehydrogenase
MFTRNPFLTGGEMIKIHNREQVDDILASARLLGKAFINGKFVDATSGKTFDNVSPRDGKVLNKVAFCDSPDVDIAVAAARRVFEAGSWSEMAPKDRKKVMLRFAQAFADNAAELAILETIDMGKPISESSSFDVEAVHECLQWYAEWCDKAYDEIAPSGPNSLGMITREPIGVVGAVTPWNFPMLMAMWKVAPALAAGNSIILKPAEQSPLTALRIAELAAESGIPEGVFNVLPGYGPTAGQAIGLHMDIDALVFTGSGAIGKKFLQYSGQSNMKRVWLECGGKSPLIVLNDCKNIKVAAETATNCMFFNQGEVCVAPSRIIVQDGIRDEFMSVVHETAAGISTGDPLDPETKMGAIVDEDQMSRILDYIAIGEGEGAKITKGGKRAMHNIGGYYVEPTIFEGVRNDMRIAQEEIFGPVMSVISVSSEEEAVQVANGSSFGLAASLWTQDLSKAHRIARKIRAGSVWVNCYDGGDITMPFGGYKQSGNGRDRSAHALDKYTELKSTWIEL